jgi:hypothetical protein
VLERNALETFEPSAEGGHQTGPASTESPAALFVAPRPATSEDESMRGMSCEGEACRHRTLAKARVLSGQLARLMEVLLQYPVKTRQLVTLFAEQELALKERISSGYTTRRSPIRSPVLPAFDDPQPRNLEDIISQATSYGTPLPCDGVLPFYTFKI